MGLNLMVLKKKLNVQKLIVLIICLDSIVYILSLEEDYHTLNLKKELDDTNLATKKSSTLISLILRKSLILWTQSMKRTLPSRV
jgi:hypothetical protein